MSSMKKAFTLVELLIVIIIIGILAAIAVPQYSNMVRKAKAAGAIPKLQQIVQAQIVYYMQYGCYRGDIGSNITIGNSDPALWGSLGLDVPNDNNFNYGFETSPDTIGVLTLLGNIPGACALPSPYIGGQWGNPNYYEVGITVDGKLGVELTDGKLQRWQ